MEKLLKSELNTTVVKLLGGSRGGYICQGQAYETDGGQVFVKSHNKPQVNDTVTTALLATKLYCCWEGLGTRRAIRWQRQLVTQLFVLLIFLLPLALKARIMFEGEMASLREIQKTNTIRVPQPIKVMDLPGSGAAFAMEYIKMRSLHKYSAKLGEQMADLHLYNKENGEKLRKKEQTIGVSQTEPNYVDKFGFHVVTCCGNITQVNEWQNDWPTFFIQHRLQAQMDLIERDYGDRKARELWEQLKPKIPEMFHSLEIIPALVHGDLWSGNVAEDDYGPIIFDPTCFYGHSEFELAIAMMFGGFSSSFFSAYHSKIPKAPGFEKRNALYKLFNYINHWNHFGTEYRGPSLNIMQSLLK